MDDLGAGRMVATLERLREQHGERFAPAPILIEMARAGSRFHPS